MPTFIMCSLMVPISVINQIKTYLMNYFWRKYGTQERGAALIAWEHVCKPDLQGIMDLFLQTETQNLLLVITT